MTPTSFLKETCFPFIFISKLIDLTLKQGDFIAGDVVDVII